VNWQKSTKFHLQHEKNCATKLGVIYL